MKIQNKLRKTLLRLENVQSRPILHHALHVMYNWCYAGEVVLCITLECLVNLIYLSQLFWSLAYITFSFYEFGRMQFGRPYVFPELK